MKNISLLVLLFAFIFNDIASAGPLIGIPIDLTIGDTQVRFLRDYNSRYQFYYLPIKPRLVKRQDKQFGEVPVFTFTKYNSDLANACSMPGGLLQFSVMVGLTPYEEEKAKEKIAKNLNLPKDRIRIRMVNVTESSIDVLGVRGQITGKSIPFITSSIFLGKGPSIRHPSIQASFVLKISPEGSTIYKDMMTGRAGLGFNYTYTYEAFTPLIHVEIDADGSAIYSHYSTSQQAKSDFGDWWFSTKTEGSWQNVRDDLVENTGLVINWSVKNERATNTGLVIEWRDTRPANKKIIELVETTMLNKLLTSIFEIESPKIDEKIVGSAVSRTSTGWFGGFSYAINKKKSMTRSKRIRFEFNAYQRISVLMNKTGGFVSIQPKNDAHKAIMFREVGIASTVDKSKTSEKIQMAINEFQGSIQQKRVLTKLLIGFARNHTNQYQIVATNNSIKSVISRYKSELDMGITPKQSNLDSKKVSAKLVLIPGVALFGNTYVLTAEILNLSTFEIVAQYIVKRNGSPEILLDLVKELWLKIEHKAKVLCTPLN